MVLVSGKPSHNIGILQAKLGYRERHEARCVRLEAMPLHQHIEGSHGEREPGLEIYPHAVHDLLEMADERQHREHCLDKHTVLPLTALTPFQVGRIAVPGLDGGTNEDNHALLN